MQRDLGRGVVLGDTGGHGGVADLHIVRQRGEQCLLDVAAQEQPGSTGQAGRVHARAAAPCPVQFVDGEPRMTAVADRLQHAQPSRGGDTGAEQHDEVPT